MSPAGRDDAERTLQAAAAVARRNASRKSAKPVGMALPAAEKVRNFVPDDAAVASREVAAEKRKQAAELEVRLQAANVPERYAAATLAKSFDYLPELVLVPQDPLRPHDPSGRMPLRQMYIDAAARVRAVLTEPILVAMLGSRGPGKTWLGCAAVLDCCRLGRSAVYLDTMDFLDQVKETYSGSGDRETRVIERYLKPWLVVLDEFHERGDTAWEDRQITRLVNKRYAARKPTVVISNQDRKEFEVRVGPSIADRFHDGGDIIDCVWGSLRGMLRAAS